MTTAGPACRICQAPTRSIGESRSAFSGRAYQLRQCPQCWFSFVADPWTEYDRIYTDAYYAGRGADPNVDYLHEFEHPGRTIRQYEWRGILTAVQALMKTTPDTRWLDYGCGHGGLVRYLRQRGHEGVFGFDIGAMTDTARRAGLPILTGDALAEAAGTFDVVTAVEVIEHVPDPLSVLSDIRRLLKPGGLLFLTTGNARPYRDRLLAWRYLVPDVHVSFFEPSTLARALEATGFRAEHRGYVPGFTDIIRFKVLKNIKARHSGVAEKLLPWPVLARVVDARFAVSGHPIGWAR